MYFGTIQIIVYIVILTFGAFPRLTCGQVGLAYSPLVREKDGEGTTRYTIDDVKVMLKLIVDKGYHKVTTYGVGSHSGVYKKNDTWTKSASVVHTALAAARINQENKKLALTVYQGMYLSNEQQVRNEIEVGFEVAQLANKDYKGTVEGVVFPSISPVNQLVANEAIIVSVAKKARELGMKAGARIEDCTTFNTRRNDATLEKILQEMDFFICLMLPDHSLTRDPEQFFNSKVLNELEITKVALSTFVNSTIQLIPETGWPAGKHLNLPNANAYNMIKFWDLTEEWAKNNGRQVFMHEAFDGPWKEGRISAIAAAYGRWRANEDSDSEYELKTGNDVSPKSGGGGLSWELTFGIIFGSILFILLASMIILVYWRVKKLNKSTKLTKEEIRHFLNGIVASENATEKNQNEAWARMPYNQDFELAKQKFSIDKTVLLGSGAFGSVFKGRIDGLISDVAFKTTRSDCPVSALRGILSEIKILTYLGKHENVVSICGAYTSEIEAGIVYVATELCSNGSLENFLRKNQANYKDVNETRYVNAPSSLHPEQITDSQLLKWALEISSAMEYISSKNIVHADLATRNVLLTLGLTAKVTDFGLSRRLYEYTEYVKKQQEPLPWSSFLWENEGILMQALTVSMFSAKSDVWSYGITMWEIFSLGDLPYPGLTWTINFVSDLENGLRVQRPSRSSERMYEIMAMCWDIEPTRRPTFSTLKENLLAMSTQLQSAEKEATK